MREVRVVGIEGIPEIRPGDDLPAIICDAFVADGFAPQDGDIVVVTQKVVSKAEGRLVRKADVEPSPFAVQWAERFGKDARHVEIVLRETKRVVRMDRGILISETHHGFVCANAGVDESNIGEDGTLALLPVDPDASAQRIREAIRARFGVEAGVIVSDTFGRPWRAGVVDVALGVAGFEPIDDWRGRKDAYGHDLRVTQVCVADEIASAAELAGGKIAGIPVCVVRGVRPPQGEGNAKAMARVAAEDLFR
jgi:coenzyme F420-0:L-glutamate ligase/coenzyme F420-1:gamma-L-glutamate ligase